MARRQSRRDSKHDGGRRRQSKLTPTAPSTESASQVSAALVARQARQSRGRPAQADESAACKFAHWIIEVPRQQETWLKGVMVPKLVAAGLRSCAFWSANKSTIFVQVFADMDRLYLEAEKSAYEYVLDKRKLREADIATNQSLQKEGLVFDPVNHPLEEADALAIPTTHTFLPGQDVFDPYEAVYAQLDLPSDHQEAHHIFDLFYRHNESGEVLSNVDALRLLLNIMQATEEENGADLQLDQLVMNKRILRYVPGAFAKRKQKLLRQWLLKVSAPWVQPLDKIRNYFGEKVAMYFAYAGSYTMWLMLPAIFGLVLFIFQSERDANEIADALAVFAIFIGIWGTLFSEKWKRNESVYAMRWGTDNYTEEEALRPAYVRSREVQKIRSFHNGKPEYWKSPLRKYFKWAVTNSVITLLVGVVIVAVVSIFYMRVMLKRLEAEGDIASGWGSHLSSIVTAIQIQIMSRVYDKLAHKLVEWENHPTNTAHENSLIVKSVMFQTINSFFSLYWIAFVKGNSDIFGESQQCRVNPNFPDDGPDCMYELRFQLLIILLTRIATSFVSNVVIPMVYPYIRPAITFVKQKIKGSDAEDLAVDGTPLVPASETEEECHLKPYETFNDYLEMMIQFGYATLFVTALPLAPFLAFVNNLAEQRLDALRLLKFSARPDPRGAGSIGAWFKYLQFLSLASVVTNLAVVTFTLDARWFGVSDFSVQFGVAVIVEHALIALKYMIAEAIPDVPYSVNLQCARREYLVTKHIDGVRDRIIDWHEVEDLVDEASQPQDASSLSEIRNPVGPATATASGAASEGADAPSVVSLDASLSDRVKSRASEVLAHFFIGRTHSDSEATQPVQWGGPKRT